ncbi:MAG: Rnf-Nqr domain containing protein, partial [Butyrivibrio crossotus]|nr:Rnf-Nqr domain containing protein [Butyrivibrio crossotus]
FDGLGMGLGFTLSLTVLGAFREMLGAGTIFGHSFIPADNPTTFEPISIFVMAPGAFFVLAFLVALMNRIKKKKGKPIVDICRDDGCLSCPNIGCSGRKIAEKEETK